MSDAIAFRCASIPALTEADADANASAASTPGLAWDRVPRRLRRSATPERSSYTAELPGNLSGVNELHAGLCRSLVQLAGFGWSDGVGLLYLFALPDGLALEDGEVVRARLRQASAKTMLDT